MCHFENCYATGQRVHISVAAAQTKIRDETLTCQHDFAGNENEKNDSWLDHSVNKSREQFRFVADNKQEDKNSQFLNKNKWEHGASFDVKTFCCGSIATQEDTSYNEPLQYIKENKVITTMVIRPLDDRTYCVRSAFTHLWALAKDLRRLFKARHKLARKCIITGALLNVRRSPTVWL